MKSPGKKLRSMTLRAGLITGLLMAGSLLSGWASVPERPSVAEVETSALSSEIVGLRVSGGRIMQRVGLDDLSSIVAPGERRMLPLLRVLDALKAEYSFEGGVLAVTRKGFAGVTIDTRDASLSFEGRSETIDLILAKSDVTGRDEIYIDAALASRLLSMDLTWNEMEYAFEGQTSVEWPIWKRTRTPSLLNTKLEETGVELPELWDTAQPLRNSLDFMEFQTRLETTTRNNEGLGSPELQTARAALWGSLFGGRYKARLFRPQTSGAVDAPPISLEDASWTYTMDQSEVAVGDSIFGLSDLTFPSLRIFGVRGNALVGGATDGQDRAERGLRKSFSQPRVFDGVAPLGSQVELIIDGRVLATREVFSDVSSPAGLGRYVFDDVILRQGRLNDIRIVVTEPDGTRRETTQYVVESAQLAPKGTFAVLGGVGSDRDRLRYDLDGIFGGARALYGATERLTIGGTVATQSDFYSRFEETSITNDNKVYPDSSTHLGMQFAWKPLDTMLLTGEVAASQGESKDTTANYDDIAIELSAELFPTKKMTWNAQLFRYGEDYFNGQNIQLRNKEGMEVDGRYEMGRGSALDYAVGHVQESVADQFGRQDEATFAHVGISTSKIPRTSLSVELDHLDPSWQPDARTSLNFRFRSSLPKNWEVYGFLSAGDTFTDSNTLQFFSGLNLSGASVFQQDSKFARVTKRVPGKGSFGASYLLSDETYRPALFGHFTRRLAGRPLSVGTTVGYDVPRGDTPSFFGTQREATPYFENSTEMLISAYGKSRVGLHTRLLQDRWRAALMFSFLTSFDGGLRTRLVKSRINPDVGGVHGKVFLDYNANGRRDRGEPGVRDVKVYMGSRLRVQTDRHGYYILPGVRRPEETRVYLDVETVPATYSPSHGIQTAMLSPGKMTRVNLGITPLIAVSGFVFSEDQEKSRNPLSGVRVLLVDPATEAEVTDSITARDGSYYLGGIKPGDYLLKIDDTTIPRDHHVTEMQRLIKILPEKDSQEIGLPAFVARYLDPDLHIAEAAPVVPKPTETTEATPELPAPTDVAVLEPPAPAPAPMPRRKLLSPDPVSTEPIPESGSVSAEMPTMAPELVLTDSDLDRFAPPVPGDLAVNWFPWATVRLEGYPELTTPCSFQGLEPGIYTITLSHPELGSEERQVTIVSGEETRLVGDFQNLGLLNVNAAPWADVLVDGVARGVTPLQLRVPSGKHTVTLMNPATNEIEATFEVDVPTGGEKKISHRRRANSGTPQ